MRNRGAGTLALSVGGVDLAVAAARGIRSPLPRSLRRFAGGGGTAGFRIWVRRRAPPRPTDARPLFSTPVWRMDATPSGSLLFEFPDVRGRVRRLVVDRRWRRGAIGWDPPSGGEVAYPLRGVVLELLTMHLLSLRGGLLVHAACVERAGRALLFVGRSGAGKSTLARLWGEAFPSARRLSDDRAGLLPSRGCARGVDRLAWTAHGTPWGGTARIASPGALPLEALVLPRKGPRCGLRRLGGGAAVARLLPCLLIPYWLPRLARASAGALDRLLDGIPVWEFTLPRNVEAARWLDQRLPR